MISLNKLGMRWKREETAGNKKQGIKSKESRNENRLPKRIYPEQAVLHPKSEPPP
jgi:hypothetical protein